MEETKLKKSSEVASDLKDIVIAVVVMIIGILLCVFTSKFLDKLEIVFTFFLFAYGAICLLGFFSNEDGRQIMVMVQAVIYITLGILLIVIPSFFLLSIGLMLLVYGIQYIVSSVKIKKISKVWGIILAYGIVALVLSLVIIVTWCFNLPQNTALILVGSTLILEGILNIVLVIILNKIEKENKNV